MDFTSLDINSSALTAQRLRMDTIAGNLANINSTRKADGTVGAYRRKEVIFAPILNQAMGSGPINRSGGVGITAPVGMDSGPSVTPMQINSGGNPYLQSGVSYDEGGVAGGVQVVAISEDQENPTNMVYNPGHPDADANGYVETPNINVVNEMVDMISATRAYEANLTAINNFKSMYRATMQM